MGNITELLLKRKKINCEVIIKFRGTLSNIKYEKIYSRNSVVLCQNSSNYSKNK